MNPAVPIAAFSSAAFLLTSAAPADLSAAFEMDARLKVELFAAEPEVIDPVALTFDEAGRMYVVEMRDYPYGIGEGKKPGGTIRLLEDSNGDGRADKSTIFARDLSFPTSVAPWKGGVFVTAPPDILYLKDTNGDGVADVCEVFFSGFMLGVTDSNVNGLRWGLDNRIHGVNGGNGGTIKPQKGSRSPVELGDADFSFDPATGELSKTYGTSAGFGLVFDEFGRSFSTYNINHLQQRIIPLRYLNRFPGMLPVESTVSISDHGNMARIFPISTAQTRPNHPEQAGHFSSAGGLGYIGYDAYPGDLYRSVVVGDVVGNLLHRDILAVNGAIFAASRSPSEKEREFLASRDPACRMTSLELGPDGALYITDMQREVIEHPDYIPEKMRSRQNIRAGEDRGRIYRVTPRDGLPRERVDFSKATPEQLVAELRHHNQWRRQTAQRLLVENQHEGVANQIAGLALQHPWAPARVQALWTLAGLRRLDASTLQQALRDRDEGVRENAVQLLERLSADRSIQHLIQRFGLDESPRVRLQMALTLGEFSGAEPQAQLIRILARDRTSYWIRAAVFSSLRSPMDAFTEILPIVAKSPGPADAELLRDLADLAIVRAERPFGRLIELLTAIEKQNDRMVIPVLEGVERGLARKGNPPQRAAVEAILARIANRNADLFTAVWRLSKRLGLSETTAQREALRKAVATAGNMAAAREERIRSIDLLRFGDFKSVGDALLGQFSGRTDSQTQAAAFRVLSAFRENDLAQELVRRWPEIVPSVRPSVLNLLLSRRSFHAALLDGIESGALKLGELNLDLEQRRALLRHSTPEIRARAARFISDDEYANRKQVVDDWLKKLPVEGDAQNGRVVFEKACAQCHRAAGIGHSVGPDLTSISHRSVEDILFNILDPNMAINPLYAAYQVETNDGESVTGIVTADSAESVTLLQAAEVTATIPRAQIKSIRATGTSLMPEGLEAAFTPADLRDLIAFLQSR